MFIRLMADYSSDGVWNERGSMMDRDDLPISDGLKADIGQWCLDYEKSQFYKAPEDRTVEFDTAAFNARGEDLARRLCVQLPGWTIGHRPQ